MGARYVPSARPVVTRTVGRGGVGRVCADVGLLIIRVKGERGETGEEEDGGEG